MKTVICFPVPLQSDHNWSIFRPCVERFTATWFQFPPEADCTVMAVCLGNDPDQSVKELFTDVPTEWVRYNGDGCDIGAAQWLSNQIDVSFLVCMNSRVFFHRRGWLKRLVDAHEKYGPALYATSVSGERRLHVRTACYALESDDLQAYPEVINSREAGREFESGENSINEFVGIQLGWPTYLVAWSTVSDNPYWWFFKMNNGFRRGDQSDVLVWDQHVTEWFASTDERRNELTRAANFSLPEA